MSKKEASRKRKRPADHRPLASGQSDGDSGQSFTAFYKADSPFSNFYPCEFEVDGNRYNCTEQYFHHKKAVLFEDASMAERILASSSPMEQKRLGRRVENYEEDRWNEVCENVMTEGCRAKFTQNLNLRKALLATGETTLVEASPRDRKWGVGLGVNNADIQDPTKWRGKNLLGQILTTVRDEIKASDQ